MSAPQVSGAGAPDYETLVEASPDALLVLTGDGTISLANAAAERMFGYARAELLGQHHRILAVKGIDSSTEQGAPTDRCDGERAAATDVVGRRKDGSEFRAEVASAPIPDSPGDNGSSDANGAARASTSQMVVTVRHASPRVEADAGLREAMSLLSATLESTADGILVVSSEGRIASANNQFVSMWGIPAELLATQDDDSLMGFVLDQLKDPGQFVDKVVELYSHPTAESIDVLDFQDGRVFERYSRPQRVAEEVVGRVWSFRDVTPAREAQKRIDQAMADLAEQAAQLKALAFKDPLTGLSNRQLFNDYLASALNGPCGTAVDLLLLDLDDFKEVNDILGHHAGDQMLIEVARRLRTCVRPDDVVARLGGDEFVVLLIGSLDPDAVATRIVESVKVPVWIDGTMLHPSLSLGLASISDGFVGASELLRRADIAMYAAKTAGKNRYLKFRPEMMYELVERTEMEAGLRLAVDSGQIVVHYQPILPTGGNSGLQVEALARWELNGRIIQPRHFIAAAERSGLIVEIGTEVLMRACTELGPWLREDAARSVAVNVSGVQLRHGDFDELVVAVTESCGVDLRQLVLEVTESVFFDNDFDVIHQLKRLRKAGVRVALDDFGTGHSSLGRLQQLPVDTLKIDQSFVAMIQTGAEELPILNAMIAMAHGLGLSVTAEGVETAAQAAYLVNLGCESLQGFLLSCPQPAAVLDAGLSRAEAAIGLTLAAHRADHTVGRP